MTEIYQRAYRLTTGGLEIEGLDLSFKISKSLNREPNTCEISLYGLNAEHRLQLNGLKNEPIKLEAGYVGSMPLLYVGTVRNVSTHRDGTEWVTTFSSAEKEKETSGKRVKKAYGKGTPIVTLLQDCATAMGLTVSKHDKAKILAGLRLGAGEVFLHGTVIQGRASDQLDRLCSTMGMLWSVQDGTLQILDIGGSTTEQAVVLTNSTGMVGSPVVDADGDITVRALIQSGLTCGRKIQVESELVTKGFWVIWKIEYTGESYGADWYADITGKALNGAGQ